MYLALSSLGILKTEIGFEKLKIITTRGFQYEG